MRFLRAISVRLVGKVMFAVLFNDKMGGEFSSSTQSFCLRLGFLSKE